MEVATEMSSMYEPKTAKKVYLYRNGVINADPKCLIVNQRQVRDFGSFLTRVTSGLKAPVAIRNIYTPAGGHKVKSLDSLKSGQYYVAGGSEQFKKIKYGGSSPHKLLSHRPPRKEFSVPSRMQQAVVASARYKKPVEKPFVIHVFRNGDFRYRGARVLLPRRIMGSWEHVLEIVTEKAELFTPAKRLCTLDGTIVHAVSELQHGGKYVVLEGTKPFQKVAYCATEDSRALMHTFPKAAIRLHRRPRRKPTQNEDGMVSDPGKTPVPLLSQLLKQKSLERRKSRPMAGRKNKEAREKAIEDHRADSIFGDSPTRDLDTSIEGPLINSTKPKISTTQHPLHKVSTVVKDTSSSEDTDTVDATVTERKPGVFHAADNGKQKEAKQEYIEETQGDTVFKAKAQRDDVEDAEVVIESHDTEVERPLDLEEAEEVEEEKGEEFEGETAPDDKVSELQAPPQHTSIDLSLNRTQPATTTTTTTTTSTSIDNNVTATEQTDSDTLPAEEGIANKDPTGSAKSAQSSRHSQVMDSNSSKPEEAQESEAQESGEKEGEENNSVIEPESTIKDESVVADEGVGADGEETNPPEEEIIEEEVTDTKEEERASQEAEEAGEPEATKDTAVEEVSEELEQDGEANPPAAAEGQKPDAVEPQPTEEEGSGEQSGVEPTTEPLDTSVPEEIVEEVDKSGQDDTGNQNEDEPTTTFVVEDHQES